MDLGELRRRVRADLDDRAPPYLASDADIDAALNDAVEEACLRARLIHDETAPAVCEIAAQEGVATYALHPSISFVDRARYGDDFNPMLPQSWAELQLYAGNWEQLTGRPDRYAVEGLQLWLVPTPDADNLATVHLKVWRKPLPAERMVADRDEPAIAEERHPYLVHWAVHRLSLRKDADLFDPEASRSALALFEGAFGQRPSAKAMRALRHHATRTMYPVRFGG